MINTFDRDFDCFRVSVKHITHENLLTNEAIFFCRDGGPPVCRGARIFLGGQKGGHFFFSGPRGGDTFLRIKELGED